MKKITVNLELGEVVDLLKSAICLELTTSLGISQETLATATVDVQFEVDLDRNVTGVKVAVTPKGEK